MNKLVNLLRQLNISLTLNEDNIDVYDPDNNLTESLVVELRDQKVQLVQLLKQLSLHNIHQKISNADKQDHYPLAPTQLSIFYAHLNNNDTTYNLPRAYFINNYSYDYLNIVFQKLIARHEVFRTSFHLIDNEPKQKISDFVDFKIIEKSAKAETLSWTIEGLILPFDLKHSPLLRVALITLDNDSQILFVDTHHIIADGISLTILFEEIESLINNRELKPLSKTYKDYCKWLQNETVKKEIKKQSKYWNNTIKDVEGSCFIPVDFQRSSVQNSTGRVFSFTLAKTLQPEIPNFCKSQNISTYNLFLACYFILLYKYSNKKSLIVGTVHEGRNHPQLEGIIGMFVKTLPIRADIDNEQSITTFISNLKETTIESLNNQDGFSENVYNRSPFSNLFNTVFVLQNIRINGLKSEIGERGVPIECNKAKFDLTFTINETNGAYEGRIEYRPELIKETTVQKLREHFEYLLSQMLNNPGSRIADIKLISSKEESLLLSKLNKSSVKFPEDKSVPEIFELIVNNYPDKIAVNYKNVYLTYNDINRESNRIANYLLKKGVKKNEIIALMFGPSEKMLCSILAIMKVGAVYLPIDKRIPLNKVNYILKDSAARIILSDDNDSLLNGLDLNDTVWISYNDISGDNMELSVPPASLSPIDPVYIIYTSGTTGNPKGTIISHENLVRLFINDDFFFDFNSDDIWTLFHSYNFDFSVWEMFGALLFGGTLVVVDFEVAKDPAKFHQLLMDKKVTVLNQTPQSFYNLVEVDELNNNSELGLRYIIFGGERLTPLKLKPWKEKYPETKLINMYGITETTVHVTYKEITDKEIESNISNIGEILPTLTGYVIDENKALVPIGFEGELCIGGKGLSRGYLNNPDLTAEKFCRIPELSQNLIYRSGDLVKLNSEFDLEYIARNDSQIKIRGYRIEPREIEFSLLNHIGITKAAVVKKEIKSQSDSAIGNSVLCAYYVSENEIPSIDLVHFLKERLPEYYIPSFFIHVVSLPLTRNGKIDYDLLPLPIDVKEENVLPADDNLEKELLVIFKKVLSHDNISILDSFFTVGGDSITVIRLIYLIESELKVKISITDFYLNDSIRKLSQFIKYRETSLNNHQRSKIREYLEDLKKNILNKISGPDSFVDIYPASGIETGMLFYYLRYKGTGVYHDHFGLKINFKNFRSDTFKKSLELIGIKHEIFRASYNVEDYEIPVKLIQKDLKLNYEFRDFSEMDRVCQEDEIQTIINRDAANYFDYKENPLCRFYSFKLDNESIFFYFSVHHAILDGWSINSFLVELCNTYTRLERDPSFQPNFLKNTYKATIEEEIFERSNEGNKAFWREYLNDFRRLEFHKIDQELTGKNMPVVMSNLSGDVFGILKRVSSELNISIKNILFSAYAYTLHFISNQQDIVVGMVTNNRPPVEGGDEILGCFLNTVPVRVKLQFSNLTWGEYLDSVNKNLLQVKKHERIPLFEISKTCRETDRNKNPFFDTLFNILDFHVLDNLETDKSSLFKYGDLNINVFTNTNTYLDFEVNITGQKLLLLPKYNPAYFTEKRVREIIEVFQKVLHLMLENGNDIIDKNKIINEAEKNFLLEAVNSTQERFSENRCLSYFFEKSAFENPEKIAVEGSKEVYTYKRLNWEANKLAHALRNHGVATNELVGIISDREPTMILGVLSIVKSGAAYVPIEINQPSDRILRIISSSNLEHLIIDSKHLKRLSKFLNTIPSLKNIYCLDDLTHTTEISELQKKIISKNEYQKLSPENLNIEISSNNIAYVIFTSGTTGFPKGVVVKHKSVVNTLEWVNKTFNISAKDKLLFVTSLGFDLSVYDIFGILMAGGIIRIASNHEILEPGQLIKILLEEKITVWDSAPASIQRLVPLFSKIRESTLKAGLRLVLLSGDWIPLQLPAMVKDVFPDVKMISLGGATEASIWSNYYPIDKVNKHWKSIPYGKPIQNFQYYVLDKNLKLCPIGVAGDLYIGGEGLALGYLNDPTLTNSKFIKNPYWKGKRIYKTGDLARWHEDGNMEFLGRNDSQVKIRGFRIEIGEIESHLNKWEKIRVSLVTIQKENDEKSLSCYFVAENQISPNEVREFLLSKVPNYMIPSHFIQLDSFPLTINGKIDRKALPSLKSIAKNENYIAPKTDTEKLVCEVFKSFFGLEKVGINDDFFVLGGDSLKAINMISIIQKEFNISIQLTDFFSLTSIKFLGMDIDNRLRLRNKSNASNKGETIYL